MPPQKGFKRSRPIPTDVNLQLSKVQTQAREVAINSLKLVLEKHISTKGNEVYAILSEAHRLLGVPVPPVDENFAGTTDETTTDGSNSNPQEKFESIVNRQLVQVKRRKISARRQQQSQSSSPSPWDSHDETCHVCKQDGELLCCDSCNLVFHVSCVRPSLTAVPDGRWSCAYCKIDAREDGIGGSGIVADHGNKSVDPVLAECGKFGFGCSNRVAIYDMMRLSKLIAIAPAVEEGSSGRGGGKGKGSGAVVGVGIPQGLRADITNRFDASMDVITISKTPTRFILKQQPAAAAAAAVGGKAVGNTNAGSANSSSSSSSDQAASLVTSSNERFRTMEEALFAALHLQEQLEEEVRAAEEEEQETLARKRRKKGKKDATSGSDDEIGGAGLDESFEAGCMSRTERRKRKTTLAADIYDLATSTTKRRGDAKEREISKISDEEGVVNEQLWCSYCLDDKLNELCVFCGCRVCHGKHNTDYLIICDGCEEEVHTYCVQPPLTSIPKGSWYCGNCIANGKGENEQGHSASGAAGSEFSVGNSGESVKNIKIEGSSSNSGGITVTDKKKGMDSGPDSCSHMFNLGLPAGTTRNAQSTDSPRSVQQCQTSTGTGTGTGTGAGASVAAGGASAGTGVGVVADNTALLGKSVDDPFAPVQLPPPSLPPSIAPGSAAAFAVAATPAYVIPTVTLPKDMLVSVQAVLDIISKKSALIKTLPDYKDGTNTTASAEVLAQVRGWNTEELKIMSLFRQFAHVTDLKTVIAAMDSHRRVLVSKMPPVAALNAKAVGGTAGSRMPPKGAIAGGGGASKNIMPPSGKNIACFYAPLIGSTANSSSAPISGSTAAVQHNQYIPAATYSNNGNGNGNGNRPGGYVNVDGGGQSGSAAAVGNRGGGVFNNPSQQQQQHQAMMLPSPPSSQQQSNNNNNSNNLNSSMAVPSTINHKGNYYYNTQVPSQVGQGQQGQQGQQPLLLLQSQGLPRQMTMTGNSSLPSVLSHTSRSPPAVMGLTQGQGRGQLPSVPTHMYSYSATTGSGHLQQTQVRVISSNTNNGNSLSSGSSLGPANNRSNFPGSNGVGSNFNSNSTAVSLPNDTAHLAAPPRLLSSGECSTDISSNNNNGSAKLSDIASIQNNNNNINNIGSNSTINRSLPRPPTQGK